MTYLVESLDGVEYSSSQDHGEASDIAHMIADACRETVLVIPVSGGTRLLDDQELVVPE